MSISKFTAALASGHNETTLALANLNFDFSLFKVEAPTEYQALGASLSNKRRTEAEAGTQHITARKLGALFDQIPPSTPNLSKAYGLRVSEISANKAVNPRGTKSDGFFTSYVGADGTAIWAAATSGQAAISVHLLACMLARMWSGPEATSVWVELVKSRKREIETMYDQGEPMNFQVLAAAQQDLTRIQLADWDASARAWLQTADEAKMREQKQLMLILKNVRLPVNHNKIVYQSVIRAWKTAMTMMENLIKGMPQLVQDGAVLLGLSAWHLYPDMVVLGNAMADVGLNDSLVAPGGSLTIGLTNVDRSDDDSGVYWSLSLRHLRYYGDPVVSSRSAGGDPSRITFEQLEMAVLGSVLSGWGNAGDDILAAANWFVALEDFLDRAVQAQNDEVEKKVIQHFLKRRGWMKILMRAAGRLVESESFERESWLMLVKLGRRRGHSFLVDRRLHPRTMFGLSDINDILSLLKGDEERVEVLRNIARNAGLSPSSTIIRYSHSGFFEFATAVPHLYLSKKRDHSGSERECWSHMRWTGVTRCDCNKKCDHQTCTCMSRRVNCSELCHAPQSMFKCYNTSTIVMGEMMFRAADRARILSLESKGEKHVSLCEVFESSLRIATTDVSFVLPWIAEFRTYFAEYSANLNGLSQGDDQEDTFDYFFGDPRTAAIYARRKINLSREVRAMRDSQRRLKPFDVIRVLKSDAVRPRALISYLKHSGMGYVTEVRRSEETVGLPQEINIPDADLFYYKSLNVFEKVAQVYKQLPNTTVAVSVLCRALHDARWAAQEIDDTLSRPQTFACIAMFESGSIDIDPEALEEVMAMSSGNSIYVAAPLLCDPSEVPKPYEVRRVIGNVGRAGIAMLIPPQAPCVREPKLESWNLINHADFDGTTEDCFKSTTLHLSFTGYEIPISTGTHGGQDTEVFLLESLVSVYNQGQWIADLDVLKHLSAVLERDEFATDVRDIRYSTGCLSTPKHPQSTVPPFQLTAIDNWEEFLDKPEFAGFVRADGNWAARLATTALSAPEHAFLITLSEEMNWQWLESLIS